MKETACTLVGLIGSAFCWAFGGWDSALAALMVCMAVDYISGSLVALVFHKTNPGPTTVPTVSKGCAKRA